MSATVADQTEQGDRVVPAVPQHAEALGGGEGHDHDHQRHRRDRAHLEADQRDAAPAIPVTIVCRPAPSGAPPVPPWYLGRPAASRSRRSSVGGRAAAGSSSNHCSAETAPGARFGLVEPSEAIGPSLSARSRRWCATRRPIRRGRPPIDRPRPSVDASSTLTHARTSVSVRPAARRPAPRLDHPRLAGCSGLARPPARRRMPDRTGADDSSAAELDRNLDRPLGMRSWSRSSPAPAPTAWTTSVIGSTRFSVVRPDRPRLPTPSRRRPGQSVPLSGLVTGSAAQLIRGIRPVSDGRSNSQGCSHGRRRRSRRASPARLLVGIEVRVELIVVGGPVAVLLPPCRPRPAPPVVAILVVPGQNGGDLAGRRLGPVGKRRHIRGGGLLDRNVGLVCLVRRLDGLVEEGGRRLRRPRHDQGPIGRFGRPRARALLAPVIAQWPYRAGGFSRPAGRDGPSRLDRVPRLDGVGPDRRDLARGFTGRLGPTIRTRSLLGPVAGAIRLGCLVLRSRGRPRRYSSRAAAAPPIVSSRGAPAPYGPVAGRLPPPGRA